jgi:tight adherence protein C
MGEPIALYAFLAVASLVLLVFTLSSGRKSRLDTRLKALTEDASAVPQTEGMMELARTALPKMGAPLVPETAEERSRLQARLHGAGYYSRQAMLYFLGIKMLLAVGPPLAGIGLSMLGMMSLLNGLMVGLALALAGLIGPGFYLDHRKKARQTSFRRALPDALDLLVICLEGGLSLPGALRRVAEELRTAHPLLALELNIVQREIQLGRTPGEALQQFGLRSDLEEVRSLSSVIVQTERYGASLTRALRIHAENLRFKRMQYAEEMAQKAATKVLFPTVFFILPCVFVVILGPGVIQIIAAMDSIMPNLRK